MSEQPAAVTYAALCQDIRDTRGTWLMYELVREAKRLAREGAFDGTVQQQGQQ